LQKNIDLVNQKYMTKMQANILLWIKGIDAIFETVVSLVGIYDLAPSKALTA
jgi:hypothetical protein